VLCAHVMLFRFTFCRPHRFLDSITEYQGKLGFQWRFVGALHSVDSTIPATSAFTLFDLLHVAVAAFSATLDDESALSHCGGAGGFVFVRDVILFEPKPEMEAAQRLCCLLIERSATRFDRVKLESTLITGASAPIDDDDTTLKAPSEAIVAATTVSEELGQLKVRVFLSRLATSVSCLSSCFARFLWHCWISVNQASQVWR
jgi:hypothetical protein